MDALELASSGSLPPPHTLKCHDCQSFFIFCLSRSSLPMCKIWNVLSCWLELTLAQGLVWLLCAWAEWLGHQFWSPITQNWGNDLFQSVLRNGEASSFFPFIRTFQSDALPGSDQSQAGTWRCKYTASPWKMLRRSRRNPTPKWWFSRISVEGQNSQGPSSSPPSVSKSSHESPGFGCRPSRPEPGIQQADCEATWRRIMAWSCMRDSSNLSRVLVFFFNLLERGLEGVATKDKQGISFKWCRKIGQNWMFRTNEMQASPAGLSHSHRVSSGLFWRQVLCGTKVRSVTCHAVNKWGRQGEWVRGADVWRSKLDEDEWPWPL